METRPSGVKEAEMQFLPGYLMSILKATPRPGRERGKMLIIIRQPYAYLVPELQRTFEGQEDVEVIMDRRYAERRASQEAVEPMEEILKIVIWDW